MRVIVGVLLSGICLLAVICAVVAFQFINSSTGPATEQVVYEVKNGMPFRLIAEQLERENVVASSWKLRILGRLTGLSSKVRRGEYGLNRAMKPQEILEVLASGKSITHPLTVPEGWNIFDIAQEFETKGFGKRQEFLQAARDPQLAESLLGEKVNSLEGYLYPETYMITKFTSARELATAMVKNFLKVWNEVGNGQHMALSRHELVTLASIVEKETGAPEERPLIASVFYNRLKSGMKLQSDPTILYGLMIQTGELKGDIQKSDILHPTPYNTYTVKALPSGPISNPGREALNAVFRPAASDYLFFVSRNDGTHVFTRTLHDHTDAVRKFQIDPKAREGHSWRELKERQGAAAAGKSVR